MSVGNWRDHIIVGCTECGKPMAYHVKSTDATCNDCDLKAYTSKIKKSLAVYQDAFRLCNKGELSTSSFVDLVEILDEYTDLIENHGAADNA